MGNYRFIDIENFENAYNERFQDYLNFSKNKQGHEIILMHLGGIIIECYLKSLIVKRYRVTKKLNNRIWSSEQQINQLNSIDQLSNRQIVEQNLGIQNPSHDIVKAYKKLESLENLISSNQQISMKFENINNPFGEENGSFINLRYSTKQNFNNIQQKFNEWEDDFRYVLRFLIEQSNNIEV